METAERQASPDGPVPALRPMSEAPRDGVFVLAVYRPPENGMNAHLAGRSFVVRHEGVHYDHDLGWALFPGYGGVPDRWFDGWLPLPGGLVR